MKDPVMHVKTVSIQQSGRNSPFCFCSSPKDVKTNTADRNIQQLSQVSERFLRLGFLLQALKGAESRWLKRSIK
jgi:hypothetical protein